MHAWGVRLSAKSENRLAWVKVVLLSTLDYSPKVAATIKETLLWRAFNEGVNPTSVTFDYVIPIDEIGRL